ncbi:MAG: 50S ribosomal protein L23 [Candidatus Altiarchaeota archaeon]|nr:50S ribosomal protein L23 [Candidatus Altiarchaeota archaeon]
MEATKVLLHPVGTEKAIRLLDQNKVVFIVSRDATKIDIKKAIHEIFKAKVDRVSTLITRKGVKKAYIKLKPDHSAVELATNLGLL